MDAVTNEVIAEVNATTGNAEATETNAFTGFTPLHMATKVDLGKLSPEEIAQYAEAAQKRLQDATHGGLLVDKRSGFVYTEGKQVGTVNRPIKATGVIPSACKVKNDHIDQGGTVTLPESAVNKTTESLVINTLASIRFLLAGQKGNGVNLVGQKGKDRTAAAVAMGTIKGGLA